MDLGSIPDYRSRGIYVPVGHVGRRFKGQSSCPDQALYRTARRMASVREELVRFLGEVETFLTDMPALLLDVPVDDVDRVTLSAEWLLRDVLLIEHILPHPYSGELVDCVCEIVATAQDAADKKKLARRRGRPALDIPEDQLSMLLEHQFSIADIARMMNVSARTVRRQILQYNLESYTEYSALTDSQLDEITSQFVHANPFSGRVSYQEFLRSTGLRVQQSRVRESLRQVDQRGMERRFRQALHRRQYSVCMPNILMATINLCIGGLWCMVGLMGIRGWWFSLKHRLTTKQQLCWHHFWRGLTTMAFLQE